MPTNVCFLCGSDSFQYLLTIREPDRFERAVGVSTERYERVWEECGNCGLAHNRYAPGVLSRLETLTASYYDADLSGRSIRDKYENVMGLPYDKSDNAQRVRRVHSFLREDRFRANDGKTTFRVLDIGAGTGVFLARFLKESDGRWTGTAVEPDPRACEHLRPLGLFTVIQDIYKGQNDLKNYDLCTFNKVLEHIKNPLDVLRTVKTALSKNGILYVEVPDKSTCALRPPHDNILGALHHHLYDVGSLSRLMSAAGYDVLSVNKYLEPSGKITVAAFASAPESFRRLAQGSGV